jgi:hypothetical protein
MVPMHVMAAMAMMLEAFIVSCSFCNALFHGARVAHAPHVAGHETKVQAYCRSQVASVQVVLALVEDCRIAPLRRHKYLKQIRL